MSFSYRPLWIKLAQENMRKEDLRLAIGISSTTLASMGKNKYVSMEVLDKICTYFGIQPNEVIEYIAEPPRK